MKRQGLVVSVKDLISLAKELCEDDIPGVGFDVDKKFQINIINKTPKCSDAWEIEQVRD